MKWFKHDTTATTDSKIKKLILRHGAVGYAVYFHCLELIAGDITETKVTFELEHDAEIIADNLKIHADGARSGAIIVEDIMRTIIELGLFEESNGHVFCLKMLKRLDASMTSNKSMRQLIAKAKNQSMEYVSIPQQCDNHDGVMTESGNIMLEERRREEKRIEKNRLEEREKREEENRLEREGEEKSEEFQSPSPKVESNFSVSDCVQSECLDEHRKTYEELHRRWVQAGLPMSTSSASSYFSFSCRELKSALGDWTGMTLTPSEILSAVENYIKLADLIKSGGSWMDSVGNFGYFAKHILDYLDGDFNIDRFKKRSIADSQQPYDKEAAMRKLEEQCREWGIKV